MYFTGSKASISFPDIHISILVLSSAKSAVILQFLIFDSPQQIQGEKGPFKCTLQREEIQELTQTKLFEAAFTESVARAVPVYLY